MVVPCSATTASGMDGNAPIACAAARAPAAAFKYEPLNNCTVPAFVVCIRSRTMIPSGLGVALLCVLFHATFIISIFDV
jgi:hypothetical protein